MYSLVRLIPWPCQIGSGLENKRKQLEVKSNPKAAQKRRTHDPLFSITNPRDRHFQHNTISTRMIFNVRDLRYRCRDSQNTTLLKFSESAVALMQPVSLSGDDGTPCVSGRRNHRRPRS